MIIPAFDERESILNTVRDIKENAPDRGKWSLPEVIFRSGFRSREDWGAWEMLSKLEGSFVYGREALMRHRIHPDFEISAMIGDNARSDEEFAMYCEFGPVWFAKSLDRQYAEGQKTNDIKH